MTRDEADALLDALLAASDDLHEAYRSKDPNRAQVAGVAWADLYERASDALVGGAG